MLEQRLLSALILFVNLLELVELALHQLTRGKTATATTNLPRAPDQPAHIVYTWGTTLNRDAVFCRHHLIDLQVFSIVLLVTAHADGRILLPSRRLDAMPGTLFRAR